MTFWRQSGSGVRLYAYSVATADMDVSTRRNATSSRPSAPPVLARPDSSLEPHWLTSASVDPATNSSAPLHWWPENARRKGGNEYSSPIMQIFRFQITASKPGLTCSSIKYLRGARSSGRVAAPPRGLRRG